MATLRSFLLAFYVGWPALLFLVTALLSDGRGSGRVYALTLLFSYWPGAWAEEGIELARHQRRRPNALLYIVQIAFLPGAIGQYLDARGSW